MHHSRFYQIFLIGLVLLFPVLFQSCAESGICLSNQHAVQVSFLSVNTDKDTTITNLSVYGVGKTDSIYSSESLSELYLPLEFDNDPDTTAFVFKYAKTADTVYFYYNKNIDFISGECGYVLQFDLLDMQSTNKKINNSEIVYPTIKYGEDIPNVQVYIY